MNAEAFRQLFEYHFTLNRTIWDKNIVPLTDEQFKHKTKYSVGSVRNQVVHILNIDDRWFSDLRGVPMPGFLNPVYYPDRKKIRAKWDTIEADMRGYLAALRDEMLFTQPFFESSKDQTYLWQILFHIVNHGTDHRAQLLALLNQLGVETKAQDYMLYLHRIAKNAKKP